MLAPFGSYQNFALSSIFHLWKQIIDSDKECFFQGAAPSHLIDATPITISSEPKKMCNFSPDQVKMCLSYSNRNGVCTFDKHRFRLLCRVLKRRLVIFLFSKILVNIAPHSKISYWQKILIPEGLMGRN